MVRHLEGPYGRHSAHVWNPDAAGPHVLALHGFTGSGADWSPLAVDLEHPVLAPDLLGHGTSPAPASAEAYRMPAVVEQTLAWCGDGPWVLLGYSMGGRVALRLAERLGERLAGLVLVSANPGIEDPSERAERAERDHALADAIATNGAAWFAERWARHPLIRSQQDLPPALLGPMTERRTTNRHEGLAGSLRGMGQGSVLPVWDRLHAIAVPTLWVTGDDDPKYTAIAARAAALQPRAQHVRMPDVGHCTHLEALPQVLPVVRRFLDGLGGPFPPHARPLR